MEEKTAKNEQTPPLLDAAGWMALPVGVMWTASFLCTMYGMGRPLVSMFGSALAIVSIYLLYRQLTNYRRLYPTASWLHTLLLSFVTCLLAGLLTDAAQYVYFAWLDDGRFLTLLGSTFASPETREAWKQMMPEVNPDEMLAAMQQLSIRDIMAQIAFYNILLALPVSLIAALPARRPRSDFKTPSDTTSPL